MLYVKGGIRDGRASGSNIWIWHSNYNLMQSLIVNLSTGVNVLRDMSLCHAFSINYAF